MAVTIDEALADLHDAFPPTPLDATHAFDGWGRTYMDVPAFIAGTSGRAWTELAATFLEFHHDALLFLNPASIGDYLPAYLSVVLGNEPGISALPTFLFGVLMRDNPARFDARFNDLSPAQRRAIARSLEALEAKWLGSHRQTDVTRALDSYWRSAASGGGQ